MIGRKERTVFLTEQKINSYHNKVLILVSHWVLKFSDSETINGVPAIIVFHIVSACTLYVYRLNIVFSPYNEVCNIESKSF